MNKYKKRPVIIEAEQWFKIGDVPEALITRLDPRTYELMCEDPENYIYKDCCLCETPEEVSLICAGDWIIKGKNGAFYPCKQSFFDKTYEAVDGE